MRYSPALGCACSRAQRTCSLLPVHVTRQEDSALTPSPVPPARPHHSLASHCGPGHGVSTVITAAANRRAAAVSVLLPSCAGLTMRAAAADCLAARMSRTEGGQ